MPMRVVASVALALAVGVWGCQKKGAENKDKKQSGTGTYRRKAMVSEARVQIRAIARALVEFYDKERVSRSGEPMPRMFVSAGPTPAKVPCGSTPHAPDPALWKGPGWRALGFSVDDPFRYQYQVIAAGKEKTATFTIRVRGDLDCDGVYSTFEQTGKVGPNGRVVVSPVRTEKELE